MNFLIYISNRMQHIIDIDAIIKSATTLVCGLIDPESSLHKGLVRGRMADRNLIREIWHYMAPRRIRCDGTPQTITTDGQHLYVLTCKRESTIHKISLITGRTVASIDHLRGARFFETCLLKHQHGMLYLVWNNCRDIAVLDLDLNFVRIIRVPDACKLAYYDVCGLAIQESRMYFTGGNCQLQSFEIDGDGTVKSHGAQTKTADVDTKHIWTTTNGDLTTLNPANGQADLVMLPAGNPDINALVLDNGLVLVEFMECGKFGCYRKSDMSPVGHITVVLKEDEGEIANWEERYTHEVCMTAGVICINMPDHGCVYVLLRPFPTVEVQN